MGTKKGGARKGQPKGSRLAYDDTKKKTKRKAPKKTWKEARDEAELIKRKKPLPSQVGPKEWTMMEHSLITSGYTPAQAIDIILRLFR